MMRFRFLIIFLLLATVGLCQDVPFGFKQLYYQKFNNPKAIRQFEFTEPSKWRITESGNPGKALEFTGISDYKPPHRSPHTIALISGMQVGSFVLEADLLQTGREYGHRDMVIVFGFRDEANFYYTHIASAMDDNAHQIMLVHNAPRTKISTFTTEGIEWGDNQWHKVRVERNIDSGSIKIFFDGKLIQEANDKTFGIGSIGFGSFDDSGKIDNIQIWSDVSKKTSRVFFSKMK